MSNPKKLQRRFDFWKVSSILETGLGLSGTDVLENAARGLIQFERLGSGIDYVPVSPEECAEELSHGDPMMFWSSGTPVDQYTLTEDALKNLLPKGLTIAELELAVVNAAGAQLQTIAPQKATQTPNVHESPKADKKSPADPVKVAAVLKAAKQEMPGLDLKNARGKWLTGKRWNLTQIASYLESERSELKIKAKTIYNILSEHRKDLPPVPAGSDSPTRVKK